MGNTRKLESAGVALLLDKCTLDVNDMVNKMSVLLEDAKTNKNLKRLEVLTKINSKRKYSSSLDENVGIVLTLIGGIAFKLIRYLLNLSSIRIIKRE
ncbi:Glycosyltransferase Family 1 protein [Rhizophagus diaphanus]|nr:Glycosyltransferase Family 1 protein [Rhizophagus diaphanus] [Rhizophagus sp. MUCL 43196]